MQIWAEVWFLTDGFLCQVTSEVKHSRKAQIEYDRSPSQKLFPLHQNQRLKSFALGFLARAILTRMSVWVTLLETAIHSPSPHNVQPWRVRVRNDHEADLLIDSTRTLPKEDPTGSFIILTMGMFI